MTALPLFLPQAPRGGWELPQARGFPELPARVKSAEGRAWVTPDGHTISRKPCPLQLPTKLSSRIQYLQQEPCSEFRKMQEFKHKRQFSYKLTLSFLWFLQNNVKAPPDPKACNWKKYKYIVLNPLCAATTVKEELEEPQSRSSPSADRMGSTPIASTEAWSGEVPGQINRWDWKNRKYEMTHWRNCQCIPFCLIMDLPSSDRGRPPATRVLAEPLPWGHLPLWITHQWLLLTRRE